jgi:DNA-binding SARP family transcriptional activator
MSNGHTLQPDFQGRLVLVTLGRASLEYVSESGSRHELLGSGKLLGLLVYLACSPRYTASRERLIDLLWADLDVEAAKHSVRQAIWFLRQRLGDQAIATRGGALTLRLSLEFDRASFLDAVEHFAFTQAVGLYRGEFLPGFAASGGAGFEQWADLERFRLRQLFLRAGETVVRDWLATGRARQARELATRVRDADPDCQSGWRLLLQTLLMARDYIAAELEAHGLEEILTRAERPAEPATAALLSLIRQQPHDSLSAPTKRTLTAELIGREREFAAILAAWDAARDGRGSYIHLIGEPGLGKTRLLADVHGRLRALGASVVLLRANPGERRVPYALASELALALASLPGAAAVSPASASALVALNPSLSSRYQGPADHAADSEALRRREIAVRELLEAVVDEQPVALLIDDVHWADATSRQILGHLVCRTLKQPLLAVTTARPGPEGTIGRVSVEPLVLRPLSVADTAVLVASLGRLPDEPWAGSFPEALHAATGGTPLLLLETLQLLVERNLLVLSQSTWTCHGPAELAVELARGWPLRRRISELSRHESWLLVLLATAGTPLPIDLLARAADRDSDAAHADLTALEIRGLAVRDGTRWRPAHDEVAAAALDLTTDEALRAANAALGRQLARTDRDDPNLLHRAARHLAAAGEERELARVFTRRMLLQRRRGERRGPRALAIDLLGSSAAPGRVTHLVQALPLYIRLGLVTRRRVAVLALIGLGVAAGAAAITFHHAPPSPDAWLALIREQPSGSLTAVEVPVRRDRWEDGSTLDVNRLGRPLPRFSVVSDRHDLAPTVDGSDWAYSRTVHDSGEIDLFTLGANGRERRLTANPGDDRAGTWSPDGRRLVIITSRWSPNRYDDLALLDPATGTVLRLTFDSGAGDPKWSPDGTRIVFTQQSRGGTSPASGKTQLCWITPDGSRKRCIKNGVGQWGLLGWYDARQILVGIDSDGPAVARLDLDTRELHVLAHNVNGPVEASRDGRWLACYCQRPATSSRAWYVFPTDRPDLARRLLVRTDQPGELVLRWLAPSASRSYLDHLQILTVPETIPVQAPFHMRAVGFDGDGEPIPVPELRWRSLDTTVATIDDTAGVLHPRRPGAVTIQASAGGWRWSARRLVVGRASWRRTFAEDWRHGIVDAWISYGEPSPVVDKGPGGRPAFWNRGDGWDESGAYSRASYSAARGLGVEAWWSSPVNGRRQQFLYLTLTPWTDSVRVTRWDHRTGSLPVLGGGCEVRIPQGDGRPRKAAFSVRNAAGGAGFVAAPDWVLSGRWYRVRIQLFPDGRCGYALDGRPIALGIQTMPLAVPYRVLLHGNSLGNRMLVGPTEIWEGVRDDVDWTALDRP